MVMELMKTSLFMALHEGMIPDFAHRCHLMNGVASAMEFLHLRGIVHRDIKSLNILLSGKDLRTAKLADFGEAKEKGFTTTHAMTMSLSTGSVASGGGGVSGTIAYQAPEVLLNQVTEASRKAEIHTFGIVLWECLTGEIPHHGKGPIQLVLLAQDQKKETMLDVPAVPPGFHDVDWLTLRNVAKACMARVAKFRPTASQVVDAMAEGPSYVFQTKPTAATIPGLPSASKPQKTNPTNTGPKTTLTIERRNKEQGRGNPWDVCFRGRVVARLENGSSFALKGIGVGEKVYLDLRGLRHTVTVRRRNPAGGNLCLRLKHKVKLKSGFTSVGESAWIEPAITGNEHLQGGFLSWESQRSGAAAPQFVPSMAPLPAKPLPARPTALPTMVVPAAAPLSAPPPVFQSTQTTIPVLTRPVYSAVYLPPTRPAPPVVNYDDDDGYDC